MIYCLLALLVVVLDQATKYFVVTHFAVGESVPVIENIFHWTFILNRGAAFGLLEGSRWLFVVIALAVVGGVFYLRKELPYGQYLKTTGVYCLFGLVMAGCVALSERMLPLHGWAMLIVQVLLGAAVYGALCLTYWKLTKRGDIFRLLRRK